MEQEMELDHDNLAFYSNLTRLVFLYLRRHTGAELTKGAHVTTMLPYAALFPSDQ